jgi:hypothetical protein
MGVPVPELNADDEPATEGLLGSLRTISAPERRKHASVYNYWLSIKRDRQFPPIRDLDPLEISDAGPFSLLLEMIGGGEDAEIRHIGQAIKGGIDAEKVGDAPNPSLLSCIATRLPVVAGCRDAFAFEDEFETADGKRRCWVTLLPFSATGTWIDYVYGFVSLDGAQCSVEEAPDAAEQPEEAEAQVEDEVAEVAAEPEELPPVEEQDETIMEIAAIEDAPPPAAEEPDADVFEEGAMQTSKTSLSARFFETIANVGGFYGRPVEIELDIENSTLESWEAEEAPQPEEATEIAEAPSFDEPAQADDPVAVDEIPQPDEPTAPEEPVQADEPISFDEPIPTPEGTLQSKLTDVRAKADEARQAKLRANVALYEGLSAAYDFALDAEDAPEEYLRLLEAQGLKIQLRSPMKPVVKLAFDGMCDDATIKQLEAVLAWAFDEELPRGALADRIEAAGGLGPILSGLPRAA